MHLGVKFNACYLSTFITLYDYKIGKNNQNLINSMDPWIHDYDNIKRSEGESIAEIIQQHAGTRNHCDCRIWHKS